MVLSGWIRAIKEDVEKACKMTKVENLNLSISTSDQMIQGKFQGKYTKDDVIKEMVEAVHTAKKLELNMSELMRRRFENTS